MIVNAPSIFTMLDFKSMLLTNNLTPTKMDLISIIN